MIDQQEIVLELVSALTEHLPLKARATHPLVKAIRQSGVSIRVNDVVTIDAIHDMGDEGGICCKLDLPGCNSNIVTSLSHLRMDTKHPLARRIWQYQLQREKRLKQPGKTGPLASAESVSVDIEDEAARVAAEEKTFEVEYEPSSQFQKAMANWSSNKFSKAAIGFWELMRQDPDDSRFCRYWLASCLLMTDDSHELDMLLRVRDDGTGLWRFAQALFVFRALGDTEESQKLLVEADHLEPAFERYLLQDELVDASHIVQFDASDELRAAGCARLFLPAWRATPGAASWARKILKVPPLGNNFKRMQRRFPLEDLRRLPLRRETWQVGTVSLMDAPRGFGPSSLMFGVISVECEQVRAATIPGASLDEIDAWNETISSFLRPLDGRPGRPETMVVDNKTFCDAWKPLLSQIGIQCRYEKNPQPVGQILRALGDIAEKPGLPPSNTVDLLKLRQTDAVWQVTFFQSPTRVSSETGGTYRPWAMLVMDKARSNVLATTLAPRQPSPETLADFVVSTMASPNGTKTLRPRVIEVADSDCYDYMRPRFEMVGVTCKLVDQMTEIDNFCLRLAKSTENGDRPSLAEGKRVTPALMELFYEAAAEYFQKAPWRHMEGEIPVEICCSDPMIGTRYGIVLGRSGVQLGFCAYDDLKTTKLILGGYGSPEDNLALAVCYDEEEIMSGVDLMLIDRYGWPIATPEAWPAVMRLQPRRNPRSATAKELLFLTACLRAIPDFVESQVDSQTTSIELGTATIELRMTWKYSL